jgi:hypothetical protein
MPIAGASLVSEDGDRTAFSDEIRCRTGNHAGGRTEPPGYSGKKPEATASGTGG